MRSLQADTNITNLQKMNSVEEVFSTIDSFFPCQATVDGNHAFDGCLESFGTRRCMEMGDTLRSLFSSLSQCGLSGMPLQNKMEKILAALRIKESLFCLETERSWERDPLFYLIPFGSAIFYMVEQDYAPLEERARHILERLRLLPRLLQESQDCLRPHSLPLVRSSIPVAYGVRVYLEETVARLCSLLPSMAGELEDAGRLALASLVYYREYLMKDLLARSASSVASPRFSLSEKITRHCLQPYSAGDLWNIAGEELATAEHTIAGQARAMAGHSRWQELLHAIMSEHPGIEALQRNYLDSIARARQFTLDYIADIPEGERVSLKDTPLFLRIHYPTVSYAASGGLETAQNTFFCITPIVTGHSEESESAQLREHAAGRIHFIPLHELYPGHHLHFVYASMNPSHAIQRTRSPVTCEGWALYGEHVAKELSYLTCSP